MSWRGRIAWYEVEYPRVSVPARSEWYHYDEQVADLVFERRPKDRKWRFAGFAWYSGEFAEGFAVRRPGGRPELPYWRADVPYWAVVFIWGAWPAIALARRRKRKQGTCPQCGYDLRATPERCPECGWGTKAA
jgi:hypothetical protein